MTQGGQRGARGGYESLSRPTGGGRAALPPPRFSIQSLAHPYRPLEEDPDRHQEMACALLVVDPVICCPAVHCSSICWRIHS